MSYKVKNIPNNLQYWIWVRKTTPRWVAEALGIPTSTFKGYLDSNYVPTIDMLCQIADVLEITPNDLLGKYKH